MLSPSDWIGYFITKSKKEIIWKPSVIQLIPRNTKYKKEAEESNEEYGDDLDDVFQDWVESQVALMNKKEKLKKNKKSK